ncbi:MAG: type II secretion system major pseudopilin GspG [Planctomycetota bacterium]|nr:type II secretion system major pseudopilin GspG [Planctomycetota bacterium]
MVAVSGEWRGFTLIEMLLVIMIIGILAGAVVVGLSGRSQDARVTRAKADISGSLSLALDLFDQDIGRYPTVEEGLKVLVEDRNIAGWKGPYLKGGLKADPWGRQYSYEVDPTYARQYVLKSAGPDGQLGTEDDVLQ